MKPIPEELLALLKYEDGKLRWAIKVGRNMNADAVAGTRAGGCAKYPVITFCNKKYAASRIVWHLFHGEIPDGYFVAHLNNDNYDTRIENLTLRTRTQSRVKGRDCKARSLPTGVAQHRKKFVAKRRNKYLGSFTSISEASAAYATAGE